MVEQNPRSEKILSLVENMTEHEVLYLDFGSRKENEFAHFFVFSQLILIVFFGLGKC